MVMFVGGVTFSEISALRWVSRQLGRPVVILTTSIITGDILMQDMLEL